MRFCDELFIRANLAAVSSKALRTFADECGTWPCPSPGFDQCQRQIPASKFLKSGGTFLEVGTGKKIFYLYQQKVWETCAF